MTKVLKDLPLVSPIDYAVNDEEFLIQNHDSQLNLIDNRQNREKCEQLVCMTNTDAHLTEILAQTLAQVDTTKLYALFAPLFFYLTDRSAY